MLSSLAEAKTVTFPVVVNLNSLYSSGTNTYLELYASPELNKQIGNACGSDAILLSLDVHYSLQKVAGDVTNATLTGSGTCQIGGN